MARETLDKILKYQLGGRLYPKVSFSDALDALDIPQKYLMEVLFGEHAKPSELLSKNGIDNKLLGMSADIVVDPLNLIPYSVIRKGFKAVKPLTTYQKIGNSIYVTDKVNDARTLIGSKDKADKYQNGGKPKPKKRIIFAEAPIITYDVTKYFDTNTNKELSENEVVKRKIIGYNNQPSENLDRYILEELEDGLRGQSSFGEISSYMIDNYGIELYDFPIIRRLYNETLNAPTEDDFESQLSSFTNQIRGSQELNQAARLSKEYLDEPIYENTEKRIEREERISDTFIKEAKAISKASKDIDGIQTEIVPIYGYDDFEKVKSKYTKDYLNDSDVILLGHHSTEKIGGIKTEDWNNYLSANMDSDNICYGGICHGSSMAKVLKDVPNFTGTVDDQWIGIPRFNNYSNKGTFEELFFGNKYTKEGIGKVVTGKPKYGVDYNNYTKNPGVEGKKDSIGRLVMTTTLIENLIQREVVPNITPLPTNIYPIKRQNGGMKNTKYPIKPKFSYQGGGYAELQGDAGSLLREIMKGTSLSGMFDKQTGSYTPVTGADYLKEKGYSKPYPKKDAFGNVTMYVRDANGNEIDAKAANAEFEAYNKNQAAQFNQNQEEFNKMLPLTQNLAGLFDLQQREQDEIANKKLRVQDFPTSYSSYAPVGFAEDGGGVSMEKSSYPSLSALYKGLPKGMSKKHKEMVASSALKEAVGISLNNYKQKMGYRNDSPFKNEPSQNIHSNVISMDNVDKTLLAIPDVGIPKMLTPNSGTHFFPGASTVTEIPKAQDGKVVSQRDSIAHQADKILKYEQLRGGEKSRPLPKYGDPMYMRQLMEGILPEVDKIMPNASAIEKAEAMDFIFNAGWDPVNNKITVDPRAYALQEYYRKYAPEKLTDTYWPDGKSWAGRKGAAYSFDEEYNNTIGKLSENERRILMNKGRDWFYQHRAPIGSTWDLRKQGPHPNYEDTWYGRIWNTNDYSEFNPNNPKFIPSRQEGGMSYPFLDSLLKEDNYESSVDDEYIKELIKKNEGSVIGKDGRHKIYKDKEGYPTIGYGHLVRGVEATSLTQENADKLFDKDYKTHKEYAEQFPGFNSLNKNQQAAIIDMTFNMGEGWFERFPKFMEAMNSGDYKTAKKELENSLWYTQVGKRAQNNIDLLFSDSPENTKGGLLAEKSKDKQNLSNSNKYSNLGSDQKAQYFSSLQNYVKNNGIEALESSDSDAAEFYKNSALQVVMSDDSGIDYELPEIEVKAKKSNKKTENRSNSKFEYNPYVDVELPREKVNYMRDVFGLNFREIGNKNKESSLNELASVLQSLFESNGALLNNGIPKMIFDPSKSTQGGIQKTKKMKKIKSYLQGGSVIRKDLIANEDSKANSYVNLPQLIPIQTEIKETVFLLPTGDLVDTNARKRHSKMSDNEVTDIVPEDSYVFSQFGDAKIYKDDASQIVMQIKTEPYNTKKTAKMPEVKTLGDVMTKNVMSPADLTRVVSNMFKTVDLDDPFTVQTNEANKFNRNAYLHAIMGLAEYDKARKGIENDYQTQMQDQGPAMVAKQGGTVKMNYKVPKAFDPLSLISLVPSLIGVINDFSDKKRLKQNTALNAADIRDYEQKAYANNDASTVISGLGTILQDTKVTPVINDTSYLDDINTNNMAYLDTASRRLTADAFNNRLDTSSMTPQQAMLFAERDNANRYESLAKSTVDLARTRAASFEKYRLLKGEADNANNASRVGAENATRAGNNSRLGILSGIISGGLENKTNIAANVLDANMANRGNYASNISQINSNTARNLQSAANVGLQMYSSEQAKKAAEAEKRGRKAIEYKEECTAQGYNWICAPDGICYCDN